MSIKKQKNKKSKQEEDFISIVLLHAPSIGRSKNKKPIGLIKIGNKFLIDRQIAALKSKFKNCEILISVECGAKEIHQHVVTKYRGQNIRVVENTTGHLTNSCETARLCLNNINNEKVMFIDGSLNFDKKVFHNADLSKTFAILNTFEEDSLDIGVNFDADKIEFFCYGASTPWSEIIFFNGRQEIYDLNELLESEEYKKKIFFEAINQMALKHKISKKMNSSQVAKIKNIKTYNKVRSMYEVCD